MPSVLCRAGRRSPTQKKPLLVCVSKERRKSTRARQGFIWFFPALTARAAFLEALQDHQVVGPRRIAAVGVATRVAEASLQVLEGLDVIFAGEPVGDVVGFAVRLNAMATRLTRLLFCTSGVLLTRLNASPDLDGVTHIILDEVHERSLHTDFLLTILRELLRRKPDLKLVLMSATLQQKIFLEYFSCFFSSAREVPVINVSGRTHPVTVRYEGQAQAASRGGMLAAAEVSDEPETREEEEFDAQIRRQYGRGAKEIRISPVVRSCADYRQIARLCAAILGGHTGTLEYGEEDDAGHQVLQTMKQCDLWAPSTYEELHAGPSATYQHPSGPLHRIDYLLLGGRATTHQLKSIVAEDFDTANYNCDHWAVEITLDGTLCGCPTQSTLRRPVYDRARMLTTEGKRQLRQAMERYEQPTWEMSVDEHCRHFQNYVCGILDALFQRDRSGPRASYIPDDVWTARNCKLVLKKKAKHRRHLWREALQAAFSGWAEAKPVPLQEWIHKESLLYQLTASAIGFATGYIKKRIAQAKTQLFAEFAEQGQLTTSQLLQKAKRCGVGGRCQQNISRELPLLLDEHGQPANSREARDEIWLKYFSEQEHGKIISVEELLQQKPVAQQLADEVEWTLADLPSIQEIEQGIRRIPKAKAMGLDMIPGEALQACPSQFALALHPLFLKAATGLQQPLQWRGGVLFECWKKKGSWSDVQNHRSLYISSVVGKLYHRLYRDKSQPQLQKALHELHLGSKRQAPMTYAAMYILGHFRQCRRARRSVGTLFLDTTAAAGLSPGVRGVVRDLHHRTWFSTRHSAGLKVATTLAGSRPGESFADAVFAFIYSKVLCKISEAANAEDLFSQYFYDQEKGPFGNGSEGTALVARDATWADDTAYPIDAETPEELMRRAVRLSTLVIQACRSFGMSPNLKRGKTAIVLSLVGKGLQKVRQKYFSHSRDMLWLPELQLSVHGAPQYIHLGGMLDMTASMQAEKRRRLALAANAYDSGRRLLYQNRAIDLSVRTKLFEISVQSTLHNLALWCPEGPAWQSLCDGYSRLLRRLLTPMVPTDKIFHIPLPMVHLLTDSWRLDLFATRQRMSLLKAMVCTGPELLWAVLQKEGKWMQTILEDLRRLREFDKTWPEISMQCWPVWWHAIREAPDKFKIRIKRCLQWTHGKQKEADKAAVGLWGLFRIASEMIPETVSQHTTWSCRQCQKTFKSRGGLGAHFYKTHGRSAAYRRCAVGSQCRACGKEFWTFARLSTHLSASTRCVAVLCQRGLTVDAVLPGHGSREWRRLQVEQFTWAPNVVTSEPVLDEAPDRWNEAATNAYKDLCDCITTGENWPTVESVQQAVMRILSCRPLYPEEEVMILDRLAGDAKDLKEASPPETEDNVSYYQVQLACEQLAESLPRVQGSQVPLNHTGQTFREFQATLDQVDWGRLIERCRQQCGTYDDALISLSDMWETECMSPREASEDSVAMFSAEAFVP
ncbi:unnamed protein product, partial [Symbiodinium necroappetens]